MKPDGLQSLNAIINGTADGILDHGAQLLHGFSLRMNLQPRAWAVYPPPTLSSRTSEMNSLTETLLNPKEMLHRPDRHNETGPQG